MSALPLLLLGGAAILLIGGKKKKSSTSTSKCPSLVFMSGDSIPSVIVNVPTAGAGTLEIGLPEVAYNEAMGGNRNIVAITKKTLAHILPGSCIGDRSISINVETDDGETMNFSAPELFYSLGMGISEDLMHAQVLNEGEAIQLVGMLGRWWSDNMGDTPVPQA